MVKECMFIENNYGYLKKNQERTFREKYIYITQIKNVAQAKQQVRHN